MISKNQIEESETWNEHLAEVPAKIKLLPPNITQSISRFKQEVLGEKAVSLDLQETLIALSISATTKPLNWRWKGSEN